MITKSDERFSTSVKKSDALGEYGKLVQLILLMTKNFWIVIQ